MLTMILAASAAMMQPTAAIEEEPVTEVMVLGMYHLANPGRDVINIDAGDVMQPGPQAELKALTESLAKWRPTKILLETQPRTEDFSIAAYRDEANKRIADNPSEQYQIGFRLAKMLGHPNVYGFDEQPDEGEPDYFPMGNVQQWAVAHGREGELGALFGWVQQYLNAEIAAVAQCSIAEKLIMHNDRAKLEMAHREIYYGLIQYGDADNQAGAELNAYWYMRNAKMFAKAELIAEPGDRILIIVGAGHKYWLDHFAENMPGFRLVDPTPYLEATEGKRCAVAA